MAPPKTGKTVLLQQIAAAVAGNHPECRLMVVLLDERPEEVTDMRRSVRGEVYASTFDQAAKQHIALAELVIERAKRLVEAGEDVVILLDSLTRLCRAHNNAAASGGRTLSGGVDAGALLGPKRFFGAARLAEEGGSLTILATALVETGSRADDFYFEELKSTGNMELRLSRELASRRVFPAVDINPSGTRREELLLSPAELTAVRGLRRALRTRDGQSDLETLLERMRETPGQRRRSCGASSRLLPATCPARRSPPARRPCCGKRVHARPDSARAARWFDGVRSYVCGMTIGLLRGRLVSTCVLCVAGLLALAPAAAAARTGRPDPGPPGAHRARRPRPAPAVRLRHAGAPAPRGPRGSPRLRAVLAGRRRRQRRGARRARRAP